MGRTASLGRESVQAAIAAAEDSRRAGRYDEGIHILKEVLRQTPRDATAHFRLGNIYIDQGNLALAEEAYLRAIELSTSYASALNNLAIVYKRQGRMRDFVKTYRKANRAVMHTAMPGSPTANAARTSRRTLGLILVIVVAAVAAFAAWQQASRGEDASRQPQARLPSATSSASADGQMWGRRDRAPAQARPVHRTLGDIHPFSQAPS